MSKPKFDPKTTQKLLTSYQSTISHYTLENDLLSSQLEDLKTTLSLNQNLLYDYIKSTIGANDEITALINESQTLWEENEQLIKQKHELEMKTSKLQELIEDTPTEIRDELKYINEANEKMKNELIEKDNTIKKLKAELDKTRRNALFKSARTEVLVTEPTKINVEINHELLNTKAILIKVSNMHAQEKKRAAKLDKEVKSLQEEIIALKKSAPIDNNSNTYNSNNNNNCSYCGSEGNNNNNNENGISSLKQNKILTSFGNLQKVTVGQKPIKTQAVVMKDDANKNKNLINDPFGVISSSEYNNKNNDNSYNNESDNDNNNSDSNSGGSDDNNNSGNNNINNNIHKKHSSKKPKNKHKELEMLTEEYSKLKKQNEEYENKIQKYKSIYKEMKNKIKNLNQTTSPSSRIPQRNNYQFPLQPTSTTDEATTSHKN